ncbi:MAG: LON peptidase substrate-binding domain-containing protein [Chloroflexi bacterium]|nr:LON peptidase substrate-binding domain-containing protein [Chloroflexota bacterium]
MLELPLFPLNTVLFPGMPLSLHIFEERYKQMIGLCIEQRTPFGVVLIKQGHEALGPLAQPHIIGCTAQIQRVQPLRQGQMNILALGQERFRILELKHDKPYLVGMVEMLPLRDSDVHAVDDGISRLRPMMMRYLDILKEAGQIQFDSKQLPEDTETLAYLAAVLLQVSSEQKQNLLASERLSVMLAELRTLYRRELALLNFMKSQSENESAKGPFSLS